MQTQKKFLKVTYLGETKRLKIMKDYATLLSLARQAFDQQELPKVIKFYYLDEENEVISINSQSDLNEALDIEDLSSLKLIVASTANEARQQLASALENNAQLAESLSNSNFLAQSISSARRFSDFQMINGEEFARRHGIKEMRQNTNEIACGGDDFLGRAVDIATDVNNLVTKEDAGSNTLRAAMKDSAVGSNPVQTSHIGCQGVVHTQDAGSDSFKTQTSNVATQNVANGKDAEVSCEIIIPDEEEAIQPESIVCWKCMGSTVNKRGLPCRKCNGSGVVTSKAVIQVVKMVREEVREFCSAQFKEMFRDYLIKKQEDQKNTVFENIVCDGCNTSPIKGIRFMCSVCSNFDLCQDCERAGVHAQHPMLKVRKSEHAPSKLVCQYKSTQHEQPITRADVKSEQKMMSSSQVSNSKNGKQEKVKYSARFVKESFSDLFEVAPGAVFFKTWTMRNDGLTAWPEDVVLIPTNGDSMGANPVILEASVPPEGEYDWTVQMKAPEKEGKYCQYFRLAFGDNIRFGHKIWCSILVKKPAEPQPFAHPIAFIDDDDLYEEIQPVHQAKPLEEEAKADAFNANDVEAFEVLPDKDGQVPNLQDENKLKVSGVFASQLSPKDVYFQKVSEEADKDLVAGLTTLYDFGFVEYKINKTLLMKYQNNANTVAEILLNGALNESTFQKIFNEQ